MGKGWVKWAPPVAVIVFGAIELSAWRLFGGHGLLVAAMAVAVFYFVLLWKAAGFSAQWELGAEYEFDRARLDSKSADPVVRQSCTEADDPTAPQSAQATLELKATRAMITTIRDDLSLPGPVAPYADRASLMAGIGRLTGWSRADPERLHKRLTDILDRIQHRIDSEYSDVATRTGWLVTAQAFLLAAFVAVTNAEKLHETTRHVLSTGVAVTGVLISLALTAAIFYGHALIERLKKSRGDAEQAAWEELGIPKTGVPVASKVHLFGHAATKTLPSAAFATWTALAILAAFDALPREPYRSITMQIPAQVVGLRPTRPSPPFAIGSSEFADEVKNCLPGAATERAAREWLDEVIDAWKRRSQPLASDMVLVIGNADRVPLSEQLRRRYGSNMGLARARAETVKRRLVEGTANADIADKLTPARILVHINGPSFTPPVAARSSAFDCGSQEQANDRSVIVWLPAWQ